jgi:hypothetical protein
MAKRLSDQERALRAIPERELQKQVQKLLNLYGWRWFHAPDNRVANGHIQNIKAGFPDLCAVKGSRLIFAELKRQTGVLHPDQIEWHEALAAAGHTVYVWRPSDLPDLPVILRTDWL